MSNRYLVSNVSLPQGTRAYPRVDGRTLWDDPIGLYAMNWPVVDYTSDELGGVLTVRESGCLTSTPARTFIVLEEDIPEDAILYA